MRCRTIVALHWSCLCRATLVLHHIATNPVSACQMDGFLRSNWHPSHAADGNHTMLCFAYRLSQLDRVVTAWDKGVVLSCGMEANF